MQFGDKNRFAITVEPGASSSFVKVSLWVNGNCLGAADDESYLNGLIASFRRMNFPPEIDIKETCVHEFLSREYCEGEYMVSLGDCFDDFLIRFLKVNGFVFLWWSNADYQFFFHRNPDSKGLMKLPEEEWIRVVGSCVVHLEFLASQLPSAGSA